MMSATVSEYVLAAANGRRIRTATQVTFADGRVIKFTERMTRRDALWQASLLIHPTKAVN